jgi:hypothetical protein
MRSPVFVDAGRFNHCLHEGIIFSKNVLSQCNGDMTYFYYLGGHFNNFSVSGT